MSTGNRLELLWNGHAYFPALLSAIERARESVLVQMYRFHGGAIATEVATSLSRAAMRGLDVRVLIDAYGTGEMEHSVADLLTRSGVRVRTYNRMTIANIHRWQQRNHRKLIALDRAEAFIGGMNIDDVFMCGTNGRAWRENAVRICGPLAATIRSAIEHAWHDDNALKRPVRKPLDPMSGDAQLLLASHDRPMIRRSYLHAIRAAVQSVHVSSAYFIPPSDVATALIDARQRGVDVRVLTTGAHNNIALARIGSRATYAPLLRAGVRIFEYRPTMLHAKSIIVDGAWCALGSANVDACGLQFNLEAQLATCDAAFVDDLQQSYCDDLAEASEITIEAWRERPWWARVGDVLARPLRYVV
jgi:cardiolipin synthase